MSNDAGEHPEPDAASGPSGDTDTRDGPSGDAEPRDGPAEESAEANALRRQQLFVGSGIAALTGMAVVVAGLQQFPGLTPVVPFGVGMVTTAATFAVVYASIFGR